MSSADDEVLVGEIAKALMGDVDRPGKTANSQAMRLFYDVYCFDLEVGSGGTFEQYFRWSDKAQIERIEAQLVELGLEEIAGAARRAIAVAFPNGIPDNPDDFEQCLELTDEQEDILETLYELEADFHVLIAKRLAIYARKNELLLQI